MNYQTHENKASLMYDITYLNELTADIERSTKDIRHRLTRKKKENIMWAFKKQAELLSRIVRNNGLHLYEVSFPPGIGGSVGDIEQFVKILEPLE